MIISTFNIPSVDDVAIMSSPTPKSSAMGIFDIAYGYMMANFIFQNFAGINWQEQLVISTIFGSFIAGFLFYIAPIERVVMHSIFFAYFKLAEKENRMLPIGHYSFKSAYNSSYIVDLKSRIASAFYLSFFAIIFWIWTPSIIDLVFSGYRLKDVALGVGVLIGFSGVWEMYHLPDKIESILDFETVIDSPYQFKIKDLVGQALCIGNWEEARDALASFREQVILPEVEPALKAFLDKLDKMITAVKKLNRNEIKTQFNAYVAWYDMSSGMLSNISALSRELVDRLKLLRYYDISQYQERFAEILANDGDSMAKEDVILRDISKDHQLSYDLAKSAVMINIIISTRGRLSPRVDMPFR